MMIAYAMHYLEHNLRPPNRQTHVEGQCIETTGKFISLEKALAYYRRNELGKHVSCLLCCEAVRESAR